MYDNRFSRQNYRSLSQACFLFLSSAGLWLLTAALFAYLAAAKLTDPFFLSNCEFFTYGKIKVAQANAFVYGWGGNAIFAVSLWILARLSQAEVRGSFFLVLAGVIWNLAITFGLLGILDGHMSGHEMLEMPTEVWPAMLISYLIITFLALVIHRSRQIKETIAPQWFILAALLWFPALFLIAWHGLEINTARGTLQTVLSMWYGQSLIWLWLTPVALGAAYYLIPAVLGRTIDKYYLAVFGFLVHCCTCSLVCGSSPRRWTRTYVDTSNWYGDEYSYGFPHRSSIHQFPCDCLFGHWQSVGQFTSKVCYFRYIVLHSFKLYRRCIFFTCSCENNPVYDH